MLFPPLKPIPYIRQPEAQSAHNRMVSLIAEDLLQRGYNVLADHINWRYGSPNKIGQHKPDVVAFDDNNFFIFEVETMDSFNKLHSLEQLKDFIRPNATTYLMLPDLFKSTGNNYVRQKVLNIKVGGVDLLFNKVTYN